MKPINPHLAQKYELRLKINKHHFEVVNIYNSQSLAYGMRKKLSLEQPQRYDWRKMYVATV